LLIPKWKLCPPFCHSCFQNNCILLLIAKRGKFLVFFHTSTPEIGENKKFEQNLPVPRNSAQMCRFELFSIFCDSGDIEKAYLSKIPKCQEILLFFFMSLALQTLGKQYIIFERNSPVPRNFAKKHFPTI
jgi:hypothetical protein